MKRRTKYKGLKKHISEERRARLNHAWGHLTRWQREQAAPQPQAQPNKALLEDLKSQRERIEDLFQLGKISMDSYDRRVAALDEKIKTAVDESTAAEGRAVKRDQVMRVLLSTLGEQAQHLPHWLNHAPPSEVNVVLHALLEKIVLRGDAIELVFWE